MSGKNSLIREHDGTFVSETFPVNSETSAFFTFLFSFLRQFDKYKDIVSGIVDNSTVL